MTIMLSHVQTLDRVQAILNCFSYQEPYLALSDFNKRLGLPKSTVHRLLTALVQHALLTRAPDGRRYALGYQLLQWASIVESALDIRAQAQPFLQELVRLTDESAVLTIRDGDWAVCISKVDSPRPVRLEMTVGKRIWLHAGSSAKILMAYLEPAEIDRIILESGLPKLLNNTITEPEELRRELALIRQNGYATSIEERDPEAAGVTAPIFDNKGRVVAGLGIVGPTSRLTSIRLAEMAPDVIALARRLSASMGQHPLP